MSNDVCRIQFSSEKPLNLNIEPIGHIEPIKAGDEITIEYQDIRDSGGSYLWPLIDILKDGDIMITIASANLRASINGRAFLEYWG